ncbi:protein-ADP-ribose hydrolase [Prevotella sp. A2931]|uniref:Protein-ADP-ribose hydrolase n=1 Tax=Prevotella illustrans TaxID=2800387 RepID=A0ABS3M610_9BACT|nr:MULTISPECIES: protein-ADP-ribose hydrolase [Prevotella]MBO1363617.1 protein-ADP-ribose hydrolase [Prevotella illustrans]PTL27202.1 protein-ADP-ribose hydrolase [Prevotella sp. oral taxon 820]
MERIRNIDQVLNLLEKESGERFPLPDTLPLKQRLMRALMNVRQPVKPSEELLAAQNEELKRQREEKGVVEIGGAGIHLWQGDITRLKVDAIVNAANSRLLGCFIPLHSCIDNAIHSAAGIQLRCECDSIMKAQGHEEPIGRAKMTRGYNLPARYVIHTVGPIVSDGVPTKAQREQLVSCYRSCLELAERNHLQSIAFCCVSTGVFRFPKRMAAEIAIQTVKAYRRQYVKTVVFNVFTNDDYEIYRQLL